MFGRELLVAISLVFVWPTFCAAGEIAGVSEAPVVSLRVEKRVPTPAGEPGKREMVYTLTNVSNKSIVAWRLGCVTVRQDGTQTHGQVGFDTYASLEEARIDTRLPPSPHTIAPGKKLDRIISYHEADLDGPMAGRTCEPTAVIFEDASFEGLKHQIDSWFSRRAQAAIDGYRGLLALDRQLAGPAKPLASDLELLEEVLKRSSADSRGLNLAAEGISTYRGFISQGISVSADEVRKSLDFQYTAAMRHLPSAWQEKVRAEVGQ